MVFRPSYFKCHIDYKTKGLCFKNNHKCVIHTPIKTPKIVWRSFLCCISCLFYFVAPLQISDTIISACECHLLKLLQKAFAACTQTKTLGFSIPSALTKLLLHVKRICKYFRAHWFKCDQLLLKRICRLKSKEHFARNCRNQVIKHEELSSFIRLKGFSPDS